LGAAGRDALGAGAALGGRRAPAADLARLAEAPLLAPRVVGLLAGVGLVAALPLGLLRLLLVAFSGARLVMPVRLLLRAWIGRGYARTSPCPRTTNLVVVRPSAPIGP
jgi:hypothetical protein